MLYPWKKEQPEEQAPKPHNIKFDKEILHDQKINTAPRAVQHESRTMTPEPMEEVICQLIGVIPE